jgi:hypothetical protein
LHHTRKYARPVPWSVTAVVLMACRSANDVVPVDELLRCAIQSWGELLRREDLRQHAAKGFERTVLSDAGVLSDPPSPPACQSRSSHPHEPQRSGRTHCHRQHRQTAMTEAPAVQAANYQERAL